MKMKSVLIFIILYSSSAYADCFRIKEDMSIEMTNRVLSICRIEYNTRLSYKKMIDGMRKHLTSAPFNWSVQCFNECGRKADNHACDKKFINEHVSIFINSSREREEFSKLCRHTSLQE